MMNEAKLLIVDDSLTIRAILEDVVTHNGDANIVGMASTAEQALERIQQVLPDIILLDLNLPDMDGMELLDRIHGVWPDIHIIIISSLARKKSLDALKALDHGAEACFDKARIISCSHELGILIDEIWHHHIRPAAHRGDAVTLPHRQHARHTATSHHEIRQMLSEGVAIAFSA